MTADLNPTLESQLAKLTQWAADTPQLWRAALAGRLSGKKAAKSWGARAAQAALRPRWLAWAAVLALFTSAAIVNLARMSRPAARDKAPSQRFPQLLSIGRPITDAGASYGEDVMVYHSLAAPDSADADRAEPVDASSGQRAITRVQTATPDPARSQGGNSVAQGPTARQIVRTATIELRVQDVRGVFMKIGMIPSAAKGEFVQDSSLNGSGQYLYGDIKLRVEATRLPKVLNELRGFGEVTSEQIKGEDVTGQAVDLDARLRNERRIEEELLALLSNREDAPLKDILDVRSKLGDVRREIESLAAQQSQLSHLVSLATVLVLLRPADAPVISHDSNWTFFKNACERSWQHGVAFLANTIATMIGIVVGGLFWWAILIVVVWLVVRRHKRKSLGRA